jgi:hypothetical protein
MSKSTTVHVSVSGRFNTKQSAQDELATFRTVASELTKHRDQLRAVVVKAGISTREGKLKIAYGGNN